MKTIGLLGGISWHSTLEYYRLINQITNNKLGGYHAARMLIYSFNFSEIRGLENTSENLLCNRLIKEARNLEKAGAACLLIGANTLHRFFEEIQMNINIPALHIADAVSKSISENGFTKVALLGTASTMEKGFYKERLKSNKVEAVVPKETDRKIVSDIIYNELVHGIISITSKEKFLNIIKELSIKESIEGVIFGCTEIPLLINEKDIEIPCFNSTEIHAYEAVGFALNE
jgi:aspartate racemase